MRIWGSELWLFEQTGTLKLGSLLLFALWNGMAFVGSGEMDFKQGVAPNYGPTMHTVFMSHFPLLRTQILTSVSDIPLS
jgi:hypothetical protein